MVIPKGTGPLESQHVHVIVRGKVQGVNFRAYAVHEANRLGITGWVRNKSDGSLEVVAEGKREVLDEFLEFLHVGSPSAEVTEVEVTWLEASGNRDSFVIRNT